MNCLLQLDGAVFYLPAYLDLELLRQDFPDAEVTEFELPVASGPARRVTYSVKTNLDGQLTGETETIEIPSFDNPPPGG